MFSSWKRKRKYKRKQKRQRMKRIENSKLSKIPSSKLREFRSWVNNLQKYQKKKGSLSKI